MYGGVLNCIIFSYNSKIQVKEMKVQIFAAALEFYAPVVFLSAPRHLARGASTTFPRNNLEMILSGSWKDIILIKDS